ncbi:MAG: helicase-exonuclease AddAB subunit AddA [Proteocatella sp.]
MSNNWTQQQQEAISTRGKILLVSAAAGSGKTAVLVERIIKILEYDNEKIETMLIVTFTNAAAREMKDRIQKKLQSRIRELTKNKEHISVEERAKIAFLKEQIKNIPRASISTVHSFCIEILRQNFQLVNIDPSFKIANESLVAILKSKAIENIFDKMYEMEDEGFLRLVDAFGGEKSDKGLLEVIYQVHRFIQAQPYPESWLRDQIASYELDMEGKDDNEKLEAFKNSIWADELLESGRTQIKRAIESCDKAIELCKAYDPPLTYIENIADDRHQIVQILKVLEDMELQKYFDQLFSFKQGRLKTISKKTIEASNYDENILERIKDIRKNAVKDDIQSLTKTFGETRLMQLIEDISYMKPYVESLIELVVDFDNEFASLKKGNGVLDFSDLEHFALKILEDEGVRQNLQDKYAHIFFDEYQDSNLVQETIIGSIKRDNNLFFVGDVKQSIYRFRLADPTLFNNRYRQYSDESNRKSQKIDLSKNFRSRREILEFCNHIFLNIMSEEVGEVDYSNESHHLLPGKAETEYNKNIEITIIEKSANQKNEISCEAQDDDLEAQETDNDELEAMYCGQKIRALVETGEVQYKDIAILMRSPKGKAKMFEKVLNKFNIPCYVDFRSSSFDKIEIKCLLDYLRIIDNKNQDEPLLGAMSSIFGGFEIDEIIQIRIAYNDIPFYNATRQYCLEKQDELAGKLRIFYGKIDKFKMLEKMWRLPQLIWHIVEDMNYSTYISGLLDGKQRLSNIKSFVDKAGEYEENEAMGLFGFLRQVDKILKDKGDSQEKSILIETENAVTIMSVHKSKGLEFDTVFLCDLGKRINEMDMRSDIILHNRLGIGMKYKNIEDNIQSDSIPRNQIKMRKNLENLSEEIRILYVALTRAVDKLYLVGSVSSLEKFVMQITKGDIERNIRKQKNYLSWICNVLVRDAGGLMLRDKVDNILTPNDITDSGIKYSINMLTPGDIDNAEQETENKKEELKEKIENHEIKDAQNVSRFEKTSNFRYKYLEDTKTPNKRSVTDITKSYKIEERQYAFEDIKINKMPVFMQDQKLFTKTEQGTIAHLIMEKIEIRKHDEASIEIELQKMLKKEMLTKEETEIVDTKAISEFFSSELGNRMIESSRVFREQSFLMKYEDIIAEGIIDCYFFEEDGIILIDYKTDEKIDEEKHRPQLEMYKKALENIYKEEVKETYIYWLSEGKYSKI